MITSLSSQMITSMWSPSNIRQNMLKSMSASGWMTTVVISFGGSGWRMKLILPFGWMTTFSSRMITFIFPENVTLPLCLYIYGYCTSIMREMDPPLPTVVAVLCFPVLSRAGVQVADGVAATAAPLPLPPAAWGGAVGPRPPLCPLDAAPVLWAPDMCTATDGGLASLGQYCWIKNERPR